MEKLANTFCGPTIDIQAKEQQETRKFSGHCRLYVGNVPNDLSEEDFVALFTPFGETNEPFLNREKMFGFIKMVNPFFFSFSNLKASMFIKIFVLSFVGLSIERGEGEERFGPDARPREEHQSAVCPTWSHRQGQELVPMGVQRAAGEGHVRLWRGTNPSFLIFFIHFSKIFPSEKNDETMLIGIAV